LLRAGPLPLGPLPVGPLSPGIIVGCSAVLLDIAGVLHDGHAAYPGAVDAIERLKAADIPLRFVTNTSRRTRAATVARLRDLGFVVADNQVFTAPLAARAYLERRALRPLLIIHPDLAADFGGLDTRDPNAVFLADAAEYCSYALLDEAFDLLMGGAPLVAVGRNRYFRAGDRLHLDAGPFVAALEYASGQKAIVAGKPSPAFFQAVLDDLGLAAADALMIGDDVDADVVGACENGLQACLVQTGKYRRGDEDRLAGCGGQVAVGLADAVEQILGGECCARSKRHTR
jgi:HAD superfamily hydrolase (TIGR01458 family)